MVAQTSVLGKSFPRRAFFAPGESVAIAAECGANNSSLGLLRISGDPADLRLIEALQNAFSARTGVQFDNSLSGPESALAGVYTGAADIAFMPREIREPMERMAFQWALLVRPFEISYARAAIEHSAEAAQLGIYVNASNPLVEVSLDDLDAVFGAEHLRAPANKRFWNALDIAGSLANMPILPVVTSVDHIGPLFFRRFVMKDSRKWNSEITQMPLDDAIRFVAATVDAIGVLPGNRRESGVRLVPVSPEGGRPAIPLDSRSVIDGSYPLLRQRTVVVHRPENNPLRPDVEAFLRFLLSEEGQKIIERSALALPLDRRAIQTQLRLLS